MAAMKIDTGVPRPDLVLNQIPRERWESVAVARSLWAEIDFPHDCRLMKQVADEADLLAEELGYESGDAFIVEYLKLDLDVVHQVISFLDQEQPTEAVAVEQVIELKAHGRPKRGEEGKHDNVIFSESPKNQGNSTDYIKARLRRDHPEIAEQLEAGEFRSARQAGIAAGFVKAIPTVRIVDDLSKVAASIAKHLTNDQRTQLAELLLRDS
jgi:hypothetical protein